jgi:iron complex outermembrane recepter protein
VTADVVDKIGGSARRTWSHHAGPVLLFLLVLGVPSTALGQAAPSTGDSAQKAPPEPAQAQQLALPQAVAAPVNRSQENVITQAADAFGTSVGDETIGLYSGSNVRGFSAFAAQNVRIEGLYYDQQGAFVDQVEAGSTIQVGVSALGYPFPAPTGIVDYQLRRVGAKQVVSVRAGFSDYYGPNLSVDASLPLTPTLGLNMGVSAEHFEYADGADLWFVRYGGVARWRPTNGVELTGFFSRYDYGDEEQSPVIFTAGSYLPPRIERRRFYGQDWAQWAGHSQNYGGIAKATLGDWQVNLGAFSSRFTFDDFAANFFRGTQRDGTATRQVLLGRDQRSQSYSGELQVIRSFAEGPRLHRLIASARVRRVDDDLGGFAFVDLGAGRIGVPDVEPEPTVQFGELTRDQVRQETGALGYELRWRGVGELNLGVQKTRYRKRVTTPGLPETAGTDSPILWNASAAYTGLPRLALYAATTRGLEESGTAPANAANANLTLPALRTRQVEAGLRYALPNGMRLVAGLFDVRRPYFELDGDNVFRVLGEVKHQGAELSLSGSPTPGLNVVAGAVLLRPRVTGEAVKEGGLGEKPLGRTGTVLDLRLDYQPPRLSALSVDFGVSYTGRRVARIDNTLYIPERAILDLGARYRFRLANAPTVLRVQVRNLTNVFGWNVSGGGGFSYVAMRRVVASLATDF